ncbi:MAG: Gfo/Idh/MocA family oxidoreductase [Lachnospiraceae bacterium]|nr:Gfo/Idh/MocA family oxidoreductase [Lachnospiraceae bacterium]
MKIGFLGAGNIATTMATTLQSVKGAECYAVAARDKKRAQAFADKYGFEKAYGSYADMLADPYVELVYINTPHSHHYDHIKMCLAHDKHVICEKAFTANASQAAEVLQLAENKGLLLTEAIWTRYMPMRQTINRVIRSGIIGKPTSLSANLGYPLEHIKRMVKPELAGGALLDLGVYVLNFASMVFGDEIKGIVADCVRYESGVDAQETIMLSYQDGKMATLYVTMLAQTDRRGMINGTNGYIEIENINNYESIRVYNLERRVVAEYAAPVQITGYEYEMMSAMQAIAEGKLECPEMPHYETVRMMLLMDSLRDAWGIRFPFEKDERREVPSEASQPKQGGDAEKTADGEKKAEDQKNGPVVRMITEQNVKEGISTRFSTLPVEAVTEPEDDEIQNMIHVIHTPPIDKRGERKRPDAGAMHENNVRMISTPVEKVKARPSGLRAGSVDEMREKLESEKGGDNALIDSAGFLGDIMLEANAGAGADSGSDKAARDRIEEIKDDPGKTAEKAGAGDAGKKGEKRKTIRIVDDAVKDYVNIRPDGNVTISAPQADIRVNQELLRKLSPSSLPLEDEGVVSEVIHGSYSGENRESQSGSLTQGSRENPAREPSENRVEEKTQQGAEPRKKKGIGRLFNSIFGNEDTDDTYDDDYLEE